MKQGARLAICSLTTRAYAQRIATAMGTAADEVFALHDKCPHKGGPLSQGIVHGRTVTCPLHSWKIGLDSGEALAPDDYCARLACLETFARHVAFVDQAEGPGRKDQLALLQKMYRQWPFFRTLLSNMDMVLAKSDLADRKSVV